MSPLDKYDMNEVKEMAYMDMKTFDIWAESNIDGFHDGQVEIDEVIAPIIRELNIKGYKTRFCCSGHPYYSVNEAFTKSEETAKGFVGLIKMEQCENTDFPVRVLYFLADNDFYISFDGVSRSDFGVPLPDGFGWDGDGIIRYWYAETEVYEFLEERLKASKALYKWAVMLPPKH